MDECRLSSLPGGDFDAITLVEQPSAPVLLLTGAATDLTIGQLPGAGRAAARHEKVRALPLASLSIRPDRSLRARHRPCVPPDCCSASGWTRPLVVRIRSTPAVAASHPGRQLIVLAEQPIKTRLCMAWGPCLKPSAIVWLCSFVKAVRDNMATVLDALRDVLEGRPRIQSLPCHAMADPSP